MFVPPKLIFSMNYSNLSVGIRLSEVVKHGLKTARTGILDALSFLQEFYPDRSDDGFESVVKSFLTKARTDSNPFVRFFG